jgi:D-alanyl-D-alanine carboxypeptidase (penicillin-binding protein 5/6)
VRARILTFLALLAAFASVWGASAPRAQAGPRIAARAALVLAPATHQWLLAQDPNRELPIASTTKLMTALIVLEHIHRLGTVFTAPNWRAAAADSQIGLSPGERMTVHDLLLALMLPSADDAAEDLAYNVGWRPGSSLDAAVGRFIGMMNAKARRLGLRQTHYSTPSGLDTPGNYSSAANLAKLAAYDMSHSRFFARVVATRAAVLESGSHPRTVSNLNDLVHEFRWVNGVKTGHTADAGYILVASGHRAGMSLITVVLGTDSPAARDQTSIDLLDYGFRNFRLVHPVRAQQVVARPGIRDRPGEHAKLLAADGLERVVPRGARVRLVIHAPRQVAGPLPSHVELGTASLLVGGRTVARVPLLLSTSLAAVSSLTIAARFITQPLMLVLIVLVALAGALAFASRQRRRARAAKGGLEAA